VNGRGGLVFASGKAFGSHAKLEQRVTGGGEGELLREDGPDAVQCVGEAGAGHVGLDLGEDAGAEVDCGGLLAERAGHGDEDAVDLGLLLVEQADELVVLLDGFEGLDEDGLPGRGRPVDNAGDAALELHFDRDDEAVAANGDEVILCAAAFAEATQRPAEALFDSAVLALHGAADAAQLGGGVVAEAAVGLDLAAQHEKQRGEVVVEQGRRQSGNPGPLITRTVRWRIDKVAPCGDALYDGEEVADLGGLEGRTIDARLIEQECGIEEAMELEASPAGEHGAHLRGALLLLVDPREIRAGLDCEHPGSPERREGTIGDMSAQAWPLQGGSAGFVQGRGDRRQ
jgi:hypothetical protein